MRIASVTMIGQFPDGIDLHVRNLRWALSEHDHIFVITTGSFITKYKLKNDARTTFIDFGEFSTIQLWIPFWNDFPRIVSDHGIAPEWFLFMEQDIWFSKMIKDEPLPDPNEIRSYLPLHNNYHSVMIDERMIHPRIWEGAVLIHGPLVQRAIDFGIDFSAHANWFINKDREHWDRLGGGKLSFRAYEQPDTMDEFTLYCALVEKKKAAYCARAAHVRGPEALHRLSRELYDSGDTNRLGIIAEQSPPYFCVYAAAAVYFIAGNWKEEADWTKMEDWYKPEFETLIRTGKEWMKSEEYERLQRVVAGLY
jgi:hypothetical protein